MNIPQHPRSSARATSELQQRALGHLASPLYRNAYFLIASAGLTSALGVVFWAVAAHEYNPATIGRNSAAISAMMLVSGVCQLGLNAVLVRYIPRAGSSTRRLVLLSYAVTAVLSAVVAFAVALSVGSWTPSLGFLGDDGRWLVAFVTATAAWTIFGLQDSVMIGLRQAQWVPLENSLFSLAKVVLLLLLAASAPEGGVFIAWNGPLLIAVILVNVLIFRRLIPRHGHHSRTSLPASRSLAVFAVGNYLGSLFFLASTTLLPLLIAAESGPRATAYFFIPWTIAMGLQLVALNMTTSLTVEVAFDESKLQEYCRRILAHTLRLVIPMVVALIAAAPYILRVFGDAYSDEGTTLLRLLSVASVPNVVVALGLSVARLQHNGRMVLWIQGAVCALTLAVSLILLPGLGIEGVGIAWLASQVTVAIWLLAGILRPVVMSSAPVAGANRDRRT